MDNPDGIRRQIELYRQYLAEGVDSERAAFYLREIKRLRTELDLLETDGDRRE